MKETGIYGNHKTIMNEESYKLAALLLDSCTYSDQGRDAKRTHEKQIQSLIQHVCCICLYVILGVAAIKPRPYVQVHRSFLCLSVYYYHKNMHHCCVGLHSLVVYSQIP